jgi:hypothetical protein
MDHHITCDICHKKLTKEYGMHHKACKRRFCDQQYAMAHAGKSTIDEVLLEESGVLEKECLTRYLTLIYS